MYKQLSFSFDRSAMPEFSEILIAFLSELPFESFEEHDTGLNAYIPSEDYDDDQAQEVLAPLKNIHPFTCIQNNIPKENWNQKWEDSYEPIVINDKCVVLAHFHKDVYPTHYIRLYIDPKMSFGTGHHDTTRLMIENMLTLDFKNKTVIDIGCGTGVLAILAHKLGAQKIFGMDIDEWSMENTMENIKKNKLNIADFDIRMNYFKDFEHHDNYDIILANINKNTILSDLSKYLNHLKDGGYLVLSGFYESDIADLMQATQEKIEKISQKTSNSWCSLVVKK